MRELRRMFKEVDQHPMVVGAPTKWITLDKALSDAGQEAQLRQRFPEVAKTYDQYLQDMAEHGISVPRSSLAALGALPAHTDILFHTALS